MYTAKICKNIDAVIKIHKFSTPIYPQVVWHKGQSELTKIPVKVQAQVVVTVTKNVNEKQRKRVHTVYKYQIPDSQDQN